ncbi:hypothetical protein [Paraburkholderia tuberum]|uniref:Uncharacterized protein n=1 Tax=Paraburkholderia tuberum TaxID=157910 RepID=A0A1H1GDH4_9BURK|nr:hypothetical protein [Paraburkholderia tuberum]SDR11304.1 hypothetical protein SAMN05445850_2846 [Paraburkholderia tuberum]
MAENDNTNVTGVFRSFMSPAGYTQRAKADKTRCDLHVTPAADSITGTCEYYYRPLGCAYTETVEKVSTASAWQTVKAFATSWDPWTDKELVHRLLHRREQLIPPNCTDSDWSRHSNFMMRHIGCGHKPPSYYVSYGYYYCSTYGAKLKPRLSDAGKDWLDNARWYLQSNMEDGLSQNMRGNVIQMRSRKPGNGSFTMEVKQFELELVEDTFQTFAFKTHPLAYLDGGLASLPSWDLAKLTMQPNIQEWGDGRTWEQAVDSGKVVLPQMINDSDMDDPIGKALGRLMAK